MATDTITYYQRGLVERGSRYEWRIGYSANSDSGQPLYPWLTYSECRADAKAQGKAAVFIRDRDYP